MSETQLRSSDDEVINVPLSSVKLCRTLVNVLEDIDGGEIPVPNVTAATLRKLLDYCALLSEEQQLDHSELSTEELFDLILAADCLECKPVGKSLVQHLAGKIKGRSPEQIRAELGIVNDFTPEEEAQLKRENQWLDKK